MTTQYTHRMTLAVPEKLMAAANQLALIAGESVDDVNTFTDANYQDGEGNKYAACSTVIKPIVLSLLNTPLSDSVLKSEFADLALAQQAMDAAVMYQDGVIATPDKIVIAIDVEPLGFFELLGIDTVDDNNIDGIAQ